MNCQHHPCDWTRFPDHIQCVCGTSWCCGCCASRTNGWSTDHCSRVMVATVIPDQLRMECAEFERTHAASWDKAKEAK